MISITRILVIESGAAPYQVAVTGCACTSVDTPTQTVQQSGPVEITVDFANQDCYDDCEVNVTVTDADGCVQTLEFTSLPNPCADFEVEIGRNGYQFQAGIVGAGAQPYTYNWYYNKSIFESKSGSDQQGTLSLRLKDGYDGPYPDQMTVTVYVTDAQGCVTFDQVNVSICQPVVGLTGETITQPCGFFAYWTPNVFPCEGRTLDYSSMELVDVRDSDNVSVVSAFSIAENPNNSGEYLLDYDLLTDPLGISQLGGTFTVSWRIADDLGVYSDVYTITLFVAPCGDGGSPGPPTNPCRCNKRAECDENDGEGPITLVVDMTDCFEKCDCNDPDKEVDANSFQIVNGPYQPGAYVVFDPGSLELSYFAPAGTVGVDVIEYFICNEAGKCSGISTLTIFLNCIEEPSLVDDQACTTCEEPVIINVLANDSGANLDPSTLQIVAQPSFGTAGIDSNYNIVYTPFTNYSGTDTFQYVVYNAGGQGGAPDPATVTVTVSCAGNGGQEVVCEADPSVVASISNDINCNNYPAEAVFDIVIGGYIDQGGSNIALEDGDLIQLQSAVLGISVELIVGENPLLPTGYQNDVGNKWAAFVTYLTVSVDMEASALLAETYTIQFDKKAWADATGYYNTYDPTTGAQTQDQAMDIDIKITVEDVSSGDTSSQASTTIEKVKIAAFEDTSVPSYTVKPKGVGTWSTSDGATPTVGCPSSCLTPSVDLESWYSQIQGSCDDPKLTLPPSEITAYKVEGAAAVSLSPGYPLTLANGEDDLLLGLNSFGPWSLHYVSCGISVLATYGVQGYNASFVISCYLKESTDTLEYFEITYENETANDGKTARMTLDQIVLF